MLSSSASRVTCGYLIGDFKASSAGSAAQTSVFEVCGPSSAVPTVNVPLIDLGFVLRRSAHHRKRIRVIPLRAGLLRAFSFRILINLTALVMFRTAEWSVSRRTSPRYLLAGGGTNPSPVNNPLGRKTACP